jgi:hypothetical protein
MRNVRYVFAAAIVSALFAGTALADDGAVAVSSKNLASMGFGNAKVMSDAEGTAVRGRGYFAFAKTVVSVNGFQKVRVDFAPPGHVAATRAFITNGTLYAKGSAFAFAK